jgi:signal transduction histidine kinase
MPPPDTAPRYDDSVLNLLRLESDKSPSTRIALYRNLIDLMMQNRPATVGVHRPRIFQTLARLHPDVPVRARRDVVQRVAAQRIDQPLDLVSWLSAADPALSVAMWQNLNLREADWLHLLPRLPMQALSHLAVRTDLPDPVRRGLASLGATGLGLPQQPVVIDVDVIEISAIDVADTGQAVHLLPVADSGTDIIPPEMEGPKPDWSQFNGKLAGDTAPENRERLNLIARAVLGGNRIDVAASNDDQPVVLLPESAAGISDSLPVPPAIMPEPPEAPGGPPEALPDLAAAASPEAGLELSGEAQQQIRDLLHRISAFRKRWVDRIAQPVADPQNATLAAVADAIEADAEAARHDLAARAAAAEGEDEPLMLTPDVAAKLEPAPVPADAATRRDVRALADIAASLADFQWASDRSGRFVSAQSVQVDVAHGAGLAPALTGRALLGLFGEPVSRTLVARALTRKTAFRDATFDIQSGPLAGQWRLSGVPQFDAGSGLFTGFRGVAQRVGRAIAALQNLPSHPVAAQAREVSRLSTDRLATLAHETRTPLNAIMGFAQLIEAQTWGDVSDQYRGKASAIMEESSRLLRALDDVSDQAKFDRGAYATQVSSFHPADAILAVRDACADEATRRGVHLLTRIHDGLPALWSDRDAIERAMARLVVVALAGAASGDVVLLTAKALPNDDVCFAVTRPQAAAGALAAPATAGASFGLRLVKHLAGALSGRLDLSERRLELVIPAMAQVAAPQLERLS